MMPTSFSSSCLWTCTPISVMVPYLSLINLNQCFVTTGHTANVNGICIDLSLHFEYWSNVQTISGIYHYLMDPIEEYSENCRCDVCQRLSTLSGALVLQLNIVKYVGGIIKKVICNLSIDEEIIFKEILVKNFVTS